MTATSWQCPGCRHREPIPDPPVGIIYCTNEECGRHGYSLDDGGLEGIPEQAPEILSTNEPIKMLGDCGGCTPEESREFQSRFGILDEIDREFRLSRLSQDK